jgi:hypothetical protein
MGGEAVLADFKPFAALDFPRARGEFGPARRG